MARPDITSLSSNGARRIYSLLCAMAHCDGRGITPPQAKILVRYQAVLGLADTECRQLERDAARLDRLNMGKRRREQKLLLDGLIEIALSDGVLGRREERLLLGVAKRCGIERTEVRRAVKDFRSGQRHSLAPAGAEVLGIDSASYVEFDPSRDDGCWAESDPYHPDSRRSPRGSGLFGGLQTPPPTQRAAPDLADPFASSAEVGSLRRAEESLFASSEEDPFTSGDAFEDSLIQAALTPDSGLGATPGGGGMQRLLTSAEIEDSGEFEMRLHQDPELLAESLCLPALPELPDLPPPAPSLADDEDLSSAGYRPLESLDAPLGLDASRVDDDGDPMLRDESETMMFPGAAPTASPFDALDDSFGGLDGKDEDLQGFWAEQSQPLPRQTSRRRSSAVESAEDSLAGLLD